MPRRSFAGAVLLIPGAIGACGYAADNRATTQDAGGGGAFVPSSGAGENPAAAGGETSARSESSAAGEVESRGGSSTDGEAEGQGGTETVGVGGESRAGSTGSADGETESRGGGESVSIGGESRGGGESVGIGGESRGGGENVGIGGESRGGSENVGIGGESRGGSENVGVGGESRGGSESSGGSTGFGTGGVTSAGAATGSRGGSSAVGGGERGMAGGASGGGGLGGTANGAASGSSGQGGSGNGAVSGSGDLGGLGGACSVVQFPILRGQLASPSPQPGECRATTCQLLPSGALEMSYCFNSCTSGTFATCLAANSANWAQFDVDFAVEPHFLEVQFEVVSASITGKLNLNYGIDPRRKFLPLVAAKETLLRGKYRRYFAPEQATFHSGSPLCANACGSCAAVHGDPNFRFETVDMTLVAEGCETSIDVTVRLLSVRLVSPGCDCESNQDCQDTSAGPQCEPPDWGSVACGKPQTLPPGLCIEAGCDPSFPVGSACAISAETKTCSGIWECHSGLPVCEVVSCP